MPGVMRRCLPRPSAAFINATELPGLMIAKALSGRDVPVALPELHVVPLAFARSSGTKTFHAPRDSTYRNGFSRTSGEEGTVVYGGSGKLCAGAFRVPTNTMFQLAPVHPPSSLFRVSHCCWLPVFTYPSTFESARKPPLDQPPSSSTRSPRMCMRRIGAACETAQRLNAPVGTTAMFSTMRQKFSVALPFLHRASACTPPVMTTSSGERPSPDSC